MRIVTPFTPPFSVIFVLIKLQACVGIAMSKYIAPWLLVAARDRHHEGRDGGAAAARGGWESQDRAVVVGADRHQPALPDHGRQRAQAHEPQAHQVCTCNKHYTDYHPKTLCVEAIAYVYGRSRESMRFFAAFYDGIHITAAMYITVSKSFYPQSVVTN